MQPLFGGEVFSKNLDGWKIYWESYEGYRYWCYQLLNSNSFPVAVVMLNPGSLSGTGENLSQDSTLRILREVFDGTGFNPFIINLFNLATPKPEKLFNAGNLKDNDRFSYSGLSIITFKAVLYAYGDYENNEWYGDEIKVRIALVKKLFSDVKEIVIPKNKSGTPKHPRVWQTQNLKTVVKEAIVKVFSSEENSNIARKVQPED